MNDVGIYDLGEIEPRPGRRSAPSETETVQLRTVVAPALAGRRRSVSAVPASLSVVLPGLGQLLHGDRTAGLFFMTFTAFIGTLSWAVHDTLSRVSRMIGLLGGPPEASVWSLAGLFGAFALLHLVAVAHAHAVVLEDGPPRPVHPAVATTASAAIPGWGQLLNGDGARALIFLLGVWITITGWLLVSGPAVALLQSLGLYLPAGVAVLTTEAVRWTLPAVVWSLAMYDAGASAVLKRRLG